MAKLISSDPEYTPLTHAPLCVNSPKEPTMTKIQASDLRMHTDRLVQTELALQNAQLARNKAKDALDSFVHNLEYPKQEA